MKILGEFGKGVPGAIALNFAQSGGINCDPGCQFFESFCYAQNLEQHRSSLRANLQWKADHLDEYLSAILQQRPKLEEAPWIRFSAFGSVPASLTDEQSHAFRAIASVLDPERTHFPVETRDKVDLYRALGFHPRLSLQTAVPEALDVPLSVVADDPADRARGWTGRNMDRARQLRRDLQARFPRASVKVCPAVLGSAKCGQCRACSGLGGADVTIFPGHA